MDACFYNFLDIYLCVYKCTPTSNVRIFSRFYTVLKSPFQMALSSSVFCLSPSVGCLTFYSHESRLLLHV